MWEQDELLIMILMEMDSMMELVLEMKQVYIASLGK